METGSEGGVAMGGTAGADVANLAGVPKPDFQNGLTGKETQPAYDWQAAFQAFYGHGQRQAPISAPVAPNPWAGQSAPPNPFGGGLPGPFFPGGYSPFSQSPASAFDPNIARVKGWLPSQLSGQLSGGPAQLQRGQGSLGSLGNLLKSNGESQSRSSGASESSHEDDKTRVDTDLSPGLQILRKRSYEHMGLDAVAARGTGMPPYQGRGAFASASPQDFTSGPGKPIASIKGMGMNPSLQATDSGNENDIWLRMGQGADLGDGKGDMDDKEVRKQRRKQSNRESARRSRLRKQAECEELSGRVDHLSKENVALRAELVRLSEQCAQLAADNRALQEELLRVRSRGPAWRPAAAPPAAGPSQARKDRPPFGAPPAFFSDRPSPELSGHAPAADSGVEGAVRPHSTRAADSQQPGAVAGWFEPRKQWAASEMPVLAGPSQTPAANTMYSTLGRREDAEAERPAGAPASPSRPTAEQELPALEVPKAGGAAASDGREAHSGGDTAPSTPGPTLTGNAAGPVRNGQAHSWLPESGQGLGEQAGLLDKELVNGQERNGTRGDLPRAASPGEAHQPGAVYTPPTVS